MGLKREAWVDYIKVLACILVVLGHFFQSMAKANIIEDNQLYQWFNTTVYYFHVPLFFICSGYLYQKYTKIESIKKWKDNVIKKALVLGIPYFIFSIVTWILKSIFSKSVNSEIGGIFDILFLNPTSPYWYLYTLFFIFLVTPTLKKKYLWILTTISISLKILVIVWQNAFVFKVYALSSVFKNEIWFVIGMIIAIVGINKLCNHFLGLALGLLFLILSIFSYRIENSFVSLGMGIVACIAVIMIFADCKESIIMNKISKYTMPVFLMHTLFAAPMRIVLLKIGITNIAIHTISGIFISFIAPVITMIFLQAIKLDFIVYPGNLLKRIHSKNINDKSS